jgi:hypothetical protein
MDFEDKRIKDCEQSNNKKTIDYVRKYAILVNKFKENGKYDRMMMHG